MREDRRDDLVSMTAIVAGAVVSVVVTIGSMLLGGKDPESIDRDYESRIVVEVEREIHEADGNRPVTMEGSSDDHGAGPEGWTDPRGPERGPTVTEWEVIARYKVIESMTATDPPTDVVDETLAALDAYSAAYPDNPYVRELLLKGLRVARYHAFESGELERAAVLGRRFDGVVAESAPYDGVVLESMWMIVQRLDQECTHVEERSRALAELGAQVADAEKVDWLMGFAEQAIGRCATRTGR